MRNFSRKINQISKRMKEVASLEAGMRAHTLFLPSDISDADRERMIAEAEATITPNDNLLYDAMITVSYVSSCESGLKYPKGRKLAPGETWRLEGGDIQQVVRK